MTDVSPGAGALAALLLGLLGSGHCAVMCGGIAGALGAAVPEAARTRSLGRARYLLAYSAGRIASYTVAGFGLGTLGAGMLAALPVHVAREAGFVVSGVCLIIAGVHLGGWWRGLAVVERAGARLWRVLEPRGRGLLPVRGLGQAVVVGALWGWLPCGLVYSALLIALSAGSPGGGALRMALFGLGTAPMVLAVGAAGSWLTTLVADRSVRRWAAACVVGLGGITLMLGLGPGAAAGPGG